MQAKQIIQLVETIFKSGQRLQRLIENFLLYAQIEAVSGDPERMNDMRQITMKHPQILIGDTATTVAQRVERTADLVLNLHDVGTVSFGADNLKKVVEELVENAFKFSQEETPVHVFAQDHASHYVVSVTNEGRGMTQEQIQAVGAYVQFERKIYEQQGAGLGLMIAKRLTSLHGGNLYIESVPDQRTTVYAAIPYA